MFIFPFPTQVCQKYAVLRELGTTKSITICGSAERQSAIYVSESNQIELYLTPKMASDGTTMHFLLKYEGKLYSIVLSFKYYFMPTNGKDYGAMYILVYSCMYCCIAVLLYLSTLISFLHTFHIFQPLHLSEWELPVTCLETNTHMQSILAHVVTV